MNTKKIAQFLSNSEDLEEAKIRLANQPKDKQMELLKDIKAFSQYIGCAGEHRVMSELMLSGVDAMDSSVDEGFDLMARKDGEVFLIQVKSTFLGKKDRYVFDLKEKNFKPKYKNIKEVVVFVMLDATKEKRGINFLVMPVEELKKQKDKDQMWYSKTTKKFRLNICLREGKAYFWKLDNDVTKFLNNWEYFLGNTQSSKTVSV